jgi:hypothetical protein
MTRLLVIFLVLLLSGQPALEGQAPPPPQLQITILEGEGALNNIKQQTAREPIVQVQDENHRPVAGALVIFTLPGSGPSGNFAGGSAEYDGVTDANGQVTATGLSPNKIAGRFQIQVDVKYHGLTAHATINQTNSVGSAGAAPPPPVAAHSFPVKAVLIAGAIAAGIGIGVVASQSGGTKPVTITTGATTVGAPAVRRH